ncbi:MAG: alpha-L-fucosidase [Acidobacteriaceae bacterium]|nr:alpha-L-fucosidase [Acidobacteriaceae bacterium]MBV9766049.1 alpha-L-fucosidase [Acidobacteriaceae bacterium]
MTITRRTAVRFLAGGIPALSLRAVQPELSPGIEIEKGPFQGTRKSLSNYEIPEWFRDAKFGIWAHWGPQSAIEDGDWYARNMYMEGSPQYNYHVKTYGPPSKFGYKDTIPAWKAEKFEPAELIRLYKKAGAKYFMSMGVHHDNFDLWNSKHQPWNAVNMGPKKDIVGMWRKVALAEGLKFGVSEHLWITYKWFSVSHGQDQTGPYAGVPYDGTNPKFFDLYVDSDDIWKDLDWNESGIPEWWKRHWYMRIKDLVDQYQPDLLYTDGSLPFEDYGLSLVAHHYNLSANRNGGKAEVVYTSKRLQDTEKGIATLDVERGVVDKIWPRPWQTDTCIGDWHYKRDIRYKTPKTVIDMLADIVSRNGNLVLNFPLPASGALDPEELKVLSEITKWMAVNSEAIHGTRPWKIFGEGPGTETSAQSSQFNESKRKDLTAADVRFTTKSGSLYALVMGWPENQAVIQPLAQQTELQVGKIQDVALLGFDGKLDWSQDSSGLKVTMPQQKPSDYAIVFKVTGAL